MKKNLGYIKGCKYKIYNKLINSYTWQKIRHKKFVANPICEMCASKGIVRATEEIHHIVPVEDGNDESEMRRLAYDFNNLQSLCKECHLSVHSRVKPIKETAKGFAERFLFLKK